MKKILAVDDSKFNLKAIVDTLSPFYNVHAVTGGIEAVDYLRLHNDISLVLLDIEMPVMNGIDTFKQIKQDENLHGIPVIFLTALSRPEMEKACLELGARDFIAKPFNGPIMLQRISAAIELNELQNSLQEQVVLKTRALESLTIQTIMSFARAVDAKDNYTKSHSENVAVLSWHIGNKLGFDNDKKHILYYSALLHDIGKIGVPDYILAKPGKLTDLEYEIIKKHTTIGGRILKDIDIMPQLSDVAMSHHERYDGKGYPHGKKGEEISLFSRIVCIADSVDAMISERSYKPSMPLEGALKEIEAQSGLQFDPSLVKVTKGIFAKGVPHEAPLEDLNLGTSFLDEIIKVYTSAQKGTDLL